jgi:hypothetical protein
MLVHKAHKAYRAMLVPQEQLGHKESKATQAPLDHRAFREMLAQLVPQGHKEYKAMLEQLDHKDHKAPQEPKAIKVYRAFKVTQAHKALALPCEAMWQVQRHYLYRAQQVMATLWTLQVTYGSGTAQLLPGQTLARLWDQKALEDNKVYRATQAHKASKASRAM